MMHRRAPWLLLIATGMAGGQPPAPSDSVVYRCQINGTVDEGIANYLLDCLERAESAQSPLLIQVDTPGGSLEATRKIVRAFLGAEVPVLAWVGPAGARAASAGLLVVMAAHHASMAPATHLGAATPVSAGGWQTPGGAMERKVLNDTVAFARMIAEQRGRNVEWAERAVTEAATATAEEASRLGVVDSLSTTEEALLTSLAGQQVAKATLPTNPTVETLQPSVSQRLMHLLSSPALAYLLVLIGGLGLAIELSHPGLIIPGAIGMASLVLAMMAFSALPVAAGAVILLVLAVGLIVAELFVASGLLGGAGALLAALAGVLLIDRVDPEWFVEPGFGLPLRLVIPTAAVTALAALLLARRVRRSQRLPDRAGPAGMVGELGRTLEEIGPAHPGEVFVHGELWRGEADKPIPPGRRVAVRAVRGLTLKLEEVT
ncbi:MAG: ATP-dependent Clp protease proteolytic subunit [Myxococcota bacterium]|nr:ATP-dependent Clp protease proteolytic subunit [Myxococcota bacterium]